MDILDQIWGSKVVTGEEKPKVPDIITFINSERAIYLLAYHIQNNSTIVIHCDVDMDGIGTGYIISRFLLNRMGKHPLCIINNDKVHGIKKQHADYFNVNAKIDLMIVVDSSSNELEAIKGFNCDVLVIDHHEVMHNDTYGMTNDGIHKWVIVNNTLDNLDIKETSDWVKQINPNAVQSIKPYSSDDRMSCGLVVYELLRLFCLVFKLDGLLENMKLYQWAGVTLFTDAIVLNTDRNQWYIENTVHSDSTEGTLAILVKSINKFKWALDKSLISYSIAPLINRSIRAGHSYDALNVILYYPDLIQNLSLYREIQDSAIAIGINDVDEHDSYVLRDLSNADIHRNYYGVIASRLAGDYRKNTVVYRIENNRIKGSFRGRLHGVDYRKFVDDYKENTFAQGHKGAFGFQCDVDDIHDIMVGLKTLENEVSTKYLVTAGKLNDINPGLYVIEDMDSFRKQGGLWRLGWGNSKLSSDEQIMITVSASELVLKEHKGKLYLYSIFGLECKAFEEINPDFQQTVNIYVECSTQLDIYIK